MKKVILKNKSNDIYLSDIKYKDIIGVLWNSGLKTFMQRSEVKGFYSIGNIGEYYVFENKVFFDTISEYCSQEQIKEVFLFDNEKELFKWMSV